MIKKIIIGMIIFIGILMIVNEKLDIISNINRIIGMIMIYMICKKEGIWG